MDAGRWLAAIVESSDDAILGKSLDGIITSWNAGATRIFGYQAGEAIGQHISFLAWPGEEGQIESFLEQLRRGERVDHFEVARRHKSGRKIIVSLSLSPVLDSSGKIIGIAKIARDITGQKAKVERLAEEVLQLRNLAEAEVLRLRDLDELNVLRLRDLDELDVLRLRNLDEAEVLRLRDLAEAEVLRLRNLAEAEVLRLRDLAEREARHKVAEQQIQVRQEYMTMLSHELRTPLHTIIGFAELLAEESSGRLNPKQQKYLNHIQHDSEHFLVLINDMLDLGRMEAGGFKLNLGSLSVRDAVWEAVESIRPFAEPKSVTVRLGNILDLHVIADPTRLRQILYNLLSNAAKFTKAGGEVYVDAAAEGHLVKITVSDNGVGISPEDRSHIFDKFYQAVVPTTIGLEGSGLGLSICRQLVELQGGTIWVESEIHTGSRFHFTLPASNRIAVADLPSRQAGGPHHRFSAS